ncbi:MAG: hypothetical protein IH624_16850 [Phycisphaerae bacterium]|nr:hypothetical protein [Phycisphaerae bacterium]
MRTACYFQSRESILDALFAVGTAKSVNVLVESFREDELSDGQKNWIAAIIGKNGDTSVGPILMSLIEEIQLEEASPDSDRVLKLNLLSALMPHAPEKTKEYLLSMQKDPGMQRHQKTIEYFLETIENARKVHGVSAAPAS